MKDLTRTFPKCTQFQDVQGQIQLKRVLLAFSRYDPNLGYVQGMNFIVGSLLYHANEEIAFWMFVTLIEEFELRDIYEPNLPGLYKHCFVLDTMIKQHLPELFTHFQTHNILVEMYASDWIFCLFSNIVPLNLTSDFYDCFFLQGWSYFYKFSLSMLGVFKDKLLEEDEFAGILSHIKFKTPEKNHGLFFAEDDSQDGASNSANKVRLFDESGQKKSIMQENVSLQGRIKKMFNFLLKKQKGIWTRIFQMSQGTQWRITEEQVKIVMGEYEHKRMKENIKGKRK